MKYRAGTFRESAAAAVLVDSRTGLHSRGILMHLWCGFAAMAGGLNGNSFAQMLTSHELFGFMSPNLATQILDFTYDNDRDLYKLTVNAVAEARKLRPVFYERKPRAERNRDIIAMLTKPRMEMAAGNLIRGWLLRKHRPMLIDFLTALEIEHNEGVVDDLPASMDDAKLKEAVELLLSKYPHEEVAVYLNAFYTMNDISWLNLKTMLQEEPRLQFAG